MPSFLGHPRATRILVPAPVYATWNPAGTNGNITLSNGNLTAELTGSPPTTAYGTSTNSGYNFDTGKRYFEIKIEYIAGSASGIAVGFTDSDQTPGYELGDLLYGYAWRCDGYRESNGEATPMGVSAANSNIVRLAIHSYVELGTVKASIWFGLNDVWLGGGDPAQGSAPAFSNAVAPLATDWTVRATMKAVGDRITANFGGSVFAYEVPDGFSSGWGENII